MGMGSRQGMKDSFKMSVRPGCNGRSVNRYKIVRRNWFGKKDSVWLCIY